MNLDFHHSWANYLVAHRAIENWKEYAQECASADVWIAWDTFAFYKDPEELMVSDEAIEKFAEDQADFVFIHGDLRLYGIEIWNTYKDQSSISSKERSVWLDTYIDRYRDLTDRNIEELVPKKIRKELPFFCALVSGLRDAIEGAYQPGPKPYGIRLGASDEVDEEPPRKKKQKEPEKPKIKPSRSTIISTAERLGRDKARSDWKGMYGGSGRIEFRIDMHHPDVHAWEWDLSESEREFFIDKYVRAYDGTIEDHLKDFAPPEAWKNASFICLLYHRMVEQGLFGGRKKEGPKGFEAYRYRAERYEHEERKKFEAGIERAKKEAQEREKREKELKKKGKK